MAIFKSFIHECIKWMWPFERPGTAKKSNKADLITVHIVYWNKKVLFLDSISNFLTPSESLDQSQTKKIGAYKWYWNCPFKFCITSKTINRVRLIYLITGLVKPKVHERASYSSELFASRIKDEKRVKTLCMYLPPM